MCLKDRESRSLFSAIHLCAEGTVFVSGFAPVKTAFKYARYLYIAFILGHPGDFQDEVILTGIHFIIVIILIEHQEFIFGSIKRQALCGIILVHLVNIAFDGTGGDFQREESYRLFMENSS